VASHWFCGVESLGLESLWNVVGLERSVVFQDEKNGKVGLKGLFESWKVGEVGRLRAGNDKVSENADGEKTSRGGSGRLRANQDVSPRGRLDP
jgi:hypothetical protein